MADTKPPAQHWSARVLAQRVEKKGLRPRIAAAVIAIVWLVAIVVFGIVEHLLDRQSFESAWDGMWWATQTVTTVGYGDVVPSEGVGRVIASVLMIGGLSLFAVITGTITSAFVARAQAEHRSKAEDPMLAKMTTIQTQLTAIRADVANLSTRLDEGPPCEPDVSSPP